MESLIDQLEQPEAKRQSLFLQDKSIPRDELRPPCPNSGSEVASASQIHDLGDAKYLEQQGSKTSDAVTSHQSPNDILVAETGSGLETAEDGLLMSEDLNALGRPVAQSPQPIRHSNSLEGDIREALVETACKERKEFLPIDALDRIVTKDRVRQEILELPNPPLTDLDEAVSQIWVTSKIPGQATSRKKLFAILALIDKRETIWDFIEEGIYDVHLPFERPESSTQGKARRGLTELSRRTDPGGQEQAIKAFRRWRDHEIRSFENRQWEICVPIFFLNSREKTTIPHYKLQRQIILPFIEDDETKQNGTAGAFSDVWRVRIHPAHHNPGMLASNKIDPPSFAIKRLHVANENAFWGEVQNLKRFSKRDHLHLIKLLGTYHWRGQYYLIFPWADGNLLDFWKSHETPIARRHDSKAALWFSKQCLGIVEGVKMIHKWEKPVPAGDTKDFSFPAGQTHGLHGDLKPENILWFKQDEGSGGDSPTSGHFKISDFGLSHFHNTISVANIDAANMGLTPTYRAPETDVKRKISQSYDIWSLACVLFEFAVWYLEGWPEVDAFTDRRAKEDMPYLDNYREDRFFNSPREDAPVVGNVTRYALGKRSVIEEFGKLYEHPDCSDYIADFLRLIETSLLRLAPEKRIDCDGIAKVLAELDTQLQEDPSYGVDRHNKPPSRSPTLESVLTNGDSSTESKRRILQMHKPENVKSARRVSISRDLSSVKELPDSQGSREIEQRTDNKAATTDIDSIPQTEPRGLLKSANIDNLEPNRTGMAQDINKGFQHTPPWTEDVQPVEHDSRPPVDSSSKDVRNLESSPLHRSSHTGPSEGDSEREGRQPGPNTISPNTATDIKDSVLPDNTDQRSDVSETNSELVSYQLAMPRDEHEMSSNCPTLHGGNSDIGDHGNNESIIHRNEHDVDMPQTRYGTFIFGGRDKMRPIREQGTTLSDNGDQGGWNWSFLRQWLCFM